MSISVNLPPYHQEQPRCQTCCHCDTRTPLIRFPTQCPRCKHNLCCDCLIDTVEVHHDPWQARNRRPVIVHPTAWSADSEYLVRCERQRRWEEESPGITPRGDDAAREIQETEQSSDEAIQETTPVMRRARRKAPARIQHAGRTHNTAVTSKRKRKAESPVPEVDEDYYDELSILRGEPGVARVRWEPVANKRDAGRVEKAPRTSVYGKSNKRYSQRFLEEEV